MFKSTRFVTFISSLWLVHILLIIVLFVDSSIFAEVVRWAYGFLGTFGLVTGGSKIAEKWQGGSDAD